MAEQRNAGIFLPTMSDKVYGKLSGFLQANLGIKLPLAKKVMLQSRALKRLKALGMSSYEEYCDFLFSPRGLEEELNHLFDVTTTNKTDFFREPAHFDFLAGQALPELSSLQAFSRENLFIVWSAGCSTGEEAYSLAVTLAEYAETNPPFDFFVLASDISTRVLETARLAIYPAERTAGVPEKMRRKYFLKSRDPSRGEIRIAPVLRNKVRFSRINLMDESYPLPARPDVIFCRNVLIYFEREIQLKLVRRFHALLLDHGYLFTGHSESFCNMGIPFRQVVPTVYQKTGNADF